MPFNIEINLHDSNIMMHALEQAFFKENEMPRIHKIDYQYFNLQAGDKVIVRSHTSKPGEGLTYPEFTGTLIDDSGCSEGWDVVDCKDIITNEVRSIYCYSIKRD